jgi:hypothetical protein
MNTAAQFGVRRAKFLDSLIQKQINLPCLPHLAPAAATKTVKGGHHSFHGRRKKGGV